MESYVDLCIVGYAWLETRKKLPGAVREGLKAEVRTELGKVKKSKAK